MKTSENIDKLALALAKAQGEMKNPEKNKTATIPTKAGGVYSYNYADLARTIDVERAALAKYEIAHFSAVDPETLILAVRLVHADQWIESALTLPPSNDPKVLAANITYFKRYLLTGLLGVAADDDLDEQPEAPTDTRKDRAPSPQSPQTAPAQPQAPIDPENVVIPLGRSRGKVLKDMPLNDLSEFVSYWTGRAEKEKRPLGGDIKTAVDAAIILLAKKEFGGVTQPQPNPQPQPQ